MRCLPPEESAVAAVSRGLYYLDSRALAALLKELHKVGLSNRCAPPAPPAMTPLIARSASVHGSLGHVRDVFLACAGPPGAPCVLVRARAHAPHSQLRRLLLLPSTCKPAVVWRLTWLGR